MSRHRLTSSGSVSERNRSTRSWVSTWVSACGWNTSLTPYSSSRYRASSFVPEIRFCHCSGSMSADSVSAPLCMSVYCSGRCTRYSAPTSRSSRASRPNSSLALSSASLPLCSPANTVPPMTVRLRWRQLVAQLRRVLRQESLRAQLGVEVAGERDLVEVLLPADLVVVAGEPHAPRVGGGAQAQLGQARRGGEWLTPLSAAVIGRFPPKGSGRDAGGPCGPRRSCRRPACCRGRTPGRRGRPTSSRCDGTGASGSVSMWIATVCGSVLTALDGLAELVDALAPG